MWGPPRRGVYLNWTQILVGDECGQDINHRISVKPLHVWVAHWRVDPLNIEHLFRSFRYEAIADKGRLGKT